MTRIGSFETNRLTVRTWQDDLADVDARAELEKALRSVLTQAVLTTLPEPLWLDQTDPDISSWVDARDAESDVRLVEVKETQSLIGLLILADTHDVGQPTTHIGYLFAESDWGRGYATELVTGLIEAAKTAGSRRFVGGVAADNPASAKVLQKAGFALDTSLSTDATRMFALNI